jgi:predicted RNase H-like HicB family nuclease
MKFKVEIFQTDQGYAASFPDLPGCFTQGASEEEVLDNAKDAIVTHLAALAKLQKRVKPKAKPSRLTEVEVFPAACNA